MDREGRDSRLYGLLLGERELATQLRHTRDGAPEGNGARAPRQSKALHQEPKRRNARLLGRLLSTATGIRKVPLGPSTRAFRHNGEEL